MSECKDMCTHNKTLCCKDCEENINCPDLCEGEEERGCEAECENRHEQRKDYPMGRLTKTYGDGTFGVADKLLVRENSHSFKKMLIDKVGAYENAEEIAGYDLCAAIYGMAGDILRLKDELAFYKEGEEKIGGKK